MKGNENKIIKQAKEIRKSKGGTILAFPINIDDPFSKYAVVVYASEQYHVYPETNNISEAALGVKIILEEFIKNGYDINYQKDVRFVVGENQLNAPDVTMRRLKNGIKKFTI